MLFDILSSAVDLVAVDLVWSHITVEGDSYQRYIIRRKGSRLSIKRRIMIVDMEGWLVDKHKKKRPRRESTQLSRFFWKDLNMKSFMYIF